MNFDFDIFMSYFGPVLAYMPITLAYTLVIFILSLIGGMIIAFLNMRNNKIVKAVLGVWLSFWRGTPQMAQLYFFVLALFPALPFFRDLRAEQLAIFCMSLSTSAYMSESVRSAIDSIEKGQMEACISIGMTNFQAMKRVVLPQAIRVAIPPLSNSFLDVLKGTSLLSIVGVVELMAISRQLTAVSYRYLESYTAMLIMYWVLNIFFAKIQKILEVKMSKSTM